MMHMRGVSIVKAIFEVDSERLARTEFLRLKSKESIERFFSDIPTFRGGF